MLDCHLIYNLLFHISNYPWWYHTYKSDIFWGEHTTIWLCTIVVSIQKSMLYTFSSFCSIIFVCFFSSGILNRSWQHMGRRYRKSPTMSTPWKYLEHWIWKRIHLDFWLSWKIMSISVMMRVCLAWSLNLNRGKTLTLALLGDFVSIYADVLHWPLDFHVSFSDLDLMSGDGLAQWLELWTGDPKVEGLNPVRSTRKTVFFLVKNIVLTRCWCAQPPCVYARKWKTMYAC